MTETFKALSVYLGSDGELTSRYYAHLKTLGPLGEVAMNLFRAQKCSTRAKVYRGRGNKEAAYATKSWSMDNLCTTLAQHAERLGIFYGWRSDTATVFRGVPSWVLYVELPEGQVSFHSPTRGAGPDYEGQWDGAKKSDARIIQFCDRVCRGGAQ